MIIGFFSFFSFELAWISTWLISYNGKINVLIPSLQHPPMASNKVAMPMSSAGIIGLSPDAQTGGRQVDPKILVIAVIAVVVIVHIATFVVG
jgi:preprotein translocase subunit Sec61beta